jgi:hypothetical protein
MMSVRIAIGCTTRTITGTPKVRSAHPTVEVRAGVSE